MNHYDYVVIGAGSGGVRSARIAAKLGAKVAIIEAAALGGTCVNLGCVPKKLMSYAGQYGVAMHESAGYGWSMSGSFNWSQFLSRKNAEISRLNGIYAKLLQDAGVNTYHGVGEVIKKDEQHFTIHVHGEIEHKLTATRVLLATGGAPIRPHLEGADQLLVSDDIFFLDKLPQSMGIIGGGYIALEFACILAELGVKIEVFVHRDKILRPFDEHLQQWILSALEQLDIPVHFNHKLQAIEHSTGSVKSSDNKQTKLVFDAQGQTLEYNFEQVLCAIGRKPLLNAVNTLKPQTTQSGHIQVNKFFETSVAQLYAVGDITGIAELTPVAIVQGQWLSENLFSDQTKAFDLKSVPTAVFTTPQMATVGETQAEVEARGQNFKMYCSEFRPLRHTLSNSKERVGIKLIVTDDEHEKVLGIHMLGADSPEIIQGLSVAFDMGMTKQNLDDTLGVHPTVAEEWVTLK